MAIQSLCFNKFDLILFEPSVTKVYSIFHPCSLEPLLSIDACSVDPITCQSHASHRVTLVIGELSKHLHTVLAVSHGSVLLLKRETWCAVHAGKVIVWLFECVRVLNCLFSKLQLEM